MKDIDFDALYDTYQGQLEDFWGRRENSADYCHEGFVFGRKVILTSNNQPILSALNFSMPAFSTAPPVATRPYRIEIIVRESPIVVGEPPASLFPLNQYTGNANWLHIQCGVWGHAVVDTTAATARVILTPQLAAHPAIVSHGLLNTILLNFVIGSGFCMLHCTGLRRNGRVVLLMAPHNTGKSTTALRLALNGYELLSDSMMFVSPDTGDDVLLLGFPVGRAKLRRDMVPFFPQLHQFLQPEAVRDEIKHSFDLRDFDRSLVCEEGIFVDSADLCLLNRHDSAETTLTPATRNDVWDALMLNSIFYDSREAWQRNLTTGNPLIERVTPYHLKIGSDPAKIVTTVNTLIT